MLEWLGSAREELCLSCVATDVRDGSPLALSAVIEELLDYASRFHGHALQDLLGLPTGGARNDGGG